MKHDWSGQFPGTEGKAARGDLGYVSRRVPGIVRRIPSSAEIRFSLIDFINPRTGCSGKNL